MIQLRLAIIAICFATVTSLGLNFDNLGSYIRAQVDSSLKPVRDMQRGMSSNRFPSNSVNLDNLGYYINQQVQASLEPVRQLENRLSAPNFIHMPDLSYLDTLGDRIEKEVHTKLQPLEARGIINDMKSGYGGRTLMKFSPSGKMILVQNNAMYECLGMFSADGHCKGTLKPFAVNNDQDFCYCTSYTAVNDYVCIFGPNAKNTLTSFVNGKWTCKAEGPYKSLSKDEYKRLCQNVATEIEYTYWADQNKKNHIQIPNSNPYVKCETVKPGMCTFRQHLIHNGKYFNSLD